MMEKMCHAAIIYYMFIKHTNKIDNNLPTASSSLFPPPFSDGFGRRVWVVVIFVRRLWSQASTRASVGTANNVECDWVSSERASPDSPSSNASSMCKSIPQKISLSIVCCVNILKFISPPPSRTKQSLSACHTTHCRIKTKPLDCAPPTPEDLFPRRDFTCAAATHNPPLARRSAQATISIRSGRHAKIRPAARKPPSLRIVAIGGKDLAVPRPRLLRHVSEKT